MDIELYGMRIFCQVMVDKTFSKAAQSLRITQPTVSQQIAKLEDRMGGKLFERVGHDIVPTQLAQDLHAFARPLLESVDEFSEKLQRKRSLPRGPVRYAMPESCQWTPHYRLIMSQIIEVPEINFKIEILPNDLIISGLKGGRIDFGFVVGERIAPELKFQKFSDESYSLVAKSKELLKPISAKEFQKLRLITYPGWEGFFNVWAKAHGLWKNLKSHIKEPAVEIGTLAGAIHAVQEGAGAAVIPTHCVAQELESKSLYKYDVGKITEASSPVYLTKRLGEKLPKRVELVIDMLMRSKAADIVEKKRA